jgi:hypothetical protein
MARATATAMAMADGNEARRKIQAIEMMSCLQSNAGTRLTGPNQRRKRKFSELVELNMQALFP